MNDIGTIAVGLGLLYLLTGKSSGINGMKKSVFASPYDGGRATFANMKKKSGVYLIKENNTIVYIGHSQSNLYKTLYRHFQKWNHPFQEVVTYRDRLNRNDYKVRVIATTPAQAPRLEAYLINKFQPRDNTQKLAKYAESNTGRSEYVKMNQIETSPF